MLENVYNVGINNIFLCSPDEQIQSGDGLGPLESRYLNFYIILDSFWVIKSIDFFICSICLRAQNISLSLNY